MPIIKGLETTFNTVCFEYDKWRTIYDTIDLQIARKP